MKLPPRLNRIFDLLQPLSLHILPVIMESQIGAIESLLCSKQNASNALAKAS